MNKNRFHLSLPCLNLSLTKEFYSQILGCELGRNTGKWCDINFFENQLTFIEDERFKFPVTHYNFRGSVLPVFHFGAIVEEEDWLEIRSKCREMKVISVSTVSFLKEEKGEHASFFVSDPNNYLVEFKCFTSAAEVFEQ